MLYLLGVSLSIFLFLILLSKKGKTLPDKILMVWLLFLGLNIFDYYLNITGLDLNFPFLLAIGAPFPLIQGPLLFLYTAALTNQLPRNKYKIAIHFVPVIALYILYIPFYRLDSSQKVEIFLQNGKGWGTQMFASLLLIYISGMVYVIWSLLLLRQHRKNIVDQFSDIEKVNLNWLRYLIIGISFIWLFVFYGNNDLIYGGVVIFIAFIGFYGIKQVGIFTQSNAYNSESKLRHLTVLEDGDDSNTGRSDTIISSSKEYETDAAEIHDRNYSKDNEFMVKSEPELIPENVSTSGFEQDRFNVNPLNDSTLKLEGATNPPDVNTGQEKKSETEQGNSVAGTKKKYQKSGLSDLGATTIHKNLTELMLSAKVFKNPELTLVELAQILNLHPNSLSQVINSLEHKNFYDYINDHRVEEFKKIVGLPKNQKYTLLALALECGFNSKTTFNRNFKKSTGLSPSEYLKKMDVDIK